MGKIKKFASVSIRKITGGKDPVRLVEEFISRRGLDPDECLKERDNENIRWMVNIEKGEDLEILVEGLKTPADTTIYMGLNVAAVPVRHCHQMVTAALEIADGLVGIKVSLVGHYLILSSTLGASGISFEDIDYHFRLITAQQSWFKSALIEELGFETTPEE